MSMTAATTVDRVRVREFADTADRIRSELARRIVGLSSVIDELLIALLAGGHGLLVGVPGLAKTLLIQSLAELTDLDYRRIQFTPDLMPSDITGTEVIQEDRHSGERSFRFLRGPLFANIVLADEINRTPPKTQSALLQSMQERQVTVGQNTYDLPVPFFVIATQNPIEQEGTYPLPEAQLDRFMFNIIVDYPTEEEERRILKNIRMFDLPDLPTIMTARHIIGAQRLVRTIAVSDYCVDYVARLIRATRPGDPSAPEFVRTFVDWGVSPRAGQYLIMAAKAFAAMDGRPNVAVDDIRAAAVPTLRHRIGTNFQAQAERVTSVDIIERLLAEVAPPEVPKYAPRRGAKVAAETDPETENDTGEPLQGNR